MVALIEYCSENLKRLNKIPHNSEAHQSQPLPRAQIELMSLKKQTTMKTRQPNLIFRRGFGIEHHQFCVHSPLLYGLFLQTNRWSRGRFVSELVTFRRERLQFLPGGLENKTAVASRGVGIQNGSRLCLQRYSTAKTVLASDCSEGEWSGPENNKGSLTGADWWAGWAEITCAKKQTKKAITHGRSCDRPLDFLRGSLPGRDKNNNLTPLPFFPQVYYGFEFDVLAVTAVVRAMYL